MPEVREAQGTKQRWHTAGLVVKCALNHAGAKYGPSGTILWFKLFWFKLASAFVAAYYLAVGSVASTSISMAELDPKYGASSLHFAVWHGNKELTRQLHCQKASISAIDRDGQTAWA